VRSKAIQGETLDKVVAVLQRTRLFQALGEGQVRLAAGQAQMTQIEPGEELLRQDEIPSSLAVVLGGELRVLQSPGEGAEPIELARFGPGQVLGIAGLLVGQPSPVSMTAAVRSTVAQFGPGFIQEMTLQAPAFGLEMARILAERLVQAVGNVPLPEADPELVARGGLLDLLPRDFMARHRVVPLAVDGTTLTIGLTDEPSPEVMQRLRSHLPGMELRPVHLDARRLGQLLGGHAGVAEPRAEAAATDPALLERLLRAMVAEGASDLHLAGGQHPRWRVDGDMREITDVPPLAADAVLALLGPALPARNQREFASSNDTDFAHSIPGLARFRVNLFRDSGGVGAVFRHIPGSIIGLEQLGMPPVVATFCDLPKGLVLVTGPTGSGKSTTLAAMVDRINSIRPVHIVTIEDPVEFLHASRRAMVNQREVGPHTDSFARALRAALREDPDIVLVGEMRDVETVTMTLEAANTGHLVLATLHTSTAVSTVERIVDLFPPEQQSGIRATLADVLKGVVCQNLLRRQGGGRVAALEILVVNNAVGNLIREAKTHQVVSTMQTGKAAGNQLLNDSLAALVNAGTVTPDEAMSKAVDKVELARRLGRSPAGA
jgi:twitching motility protein PilT